MDAQLKKMFAEGLQQRYERHARMADMTREWARSQGFALFAAEGYASMTLTSVRNTREVDLEGIKKTVGERGYAMDNGYGKIKNETFRIPHMADMQPVYLEEYFGVLEQVLPPLE